MQYLIVDGMMSGTGVRVRYETGFLDLNRLELSDALREKIKLWGAAYSEQHLQGFDDLARVKELDEEGINIRNQIAETIPQAKVGYYSAAKCDMLVWG